MFHVTSDFYNILKNLKIKIIDNYKYSVLTYDILGMGVAVWRGIEREVIKKKRINE